jgi:hypothetical protein
MAPGVWVPVVQMALFCVGADRLLAAARRPVPQPRSSAASRAVGLVGWFAAGDFCGSVGTMSTRPVTRVAVLDGVRAVEQRLAAQPIHKVIPHALSGCADGG